MGGKMAEVLQSQKVSLIEETIRNGLGSLSCDGSLMVETGKFTGRAVKDRFIANRPEISQSIAWNSANMPIDPELSKAFFERLEKRVQSKKNYSIDAFVGPFPIEVLSTSPWHIAFCDNMFRNSRSPLPGFRGGDTRIKIYHDPFGKVSDLGLNHPSETLLILDPVEMKAGIIGTAYAGEIKKSAFTLCNYKLPSFGIFPFGSFGAFFTFFTVYKLLYMVLYGLLCIILCIMLCIIYNNTLISIIITDSYDGKSAVHFAVYHPVRF
jgi:ATP-dependent phosphoenolpyruvate carboxykinase